MKFRALVNRRENLALCFVLALATFLRLFRLGHQSLWIDEINAVILANKSLFGILFTGDTTPPFIYIINHFWQKLGGSDFMVRLPSVFFGVASVYAAYKFTKALFTDKEALFCAFLMSISLYHVVYSQEAARPYAAFIFFSLLSLYYFIKFLKTNLNKYKLGFIIFSVLSFYTHLFTIFVIVGEAVIWLSVSALKIFRERQGYKAIHKVLLNFVRSLIAIAVLSLPVLIQFVSAKESSLGGGNVVLNAVFLKNLLCRYGAGNGLAFFIYNFFFLAGIYSLIKKDGRREVFLLIFLLTFPFIAISFMQLKHFFHIRYVIFTYPLYIIIVSKGITNFLQISKKHSHKVSAFLILLFLFLSLAPLTLYYQMPARLTDWRGAADYIYANANKGDKVITNGVHDTLIKYYLERKSVHKEISAVTHNNSLPTFEDLLLTNTGTGRIYYVGYGEDVGYGTDEFSLLAEDYFNNKEVFFSEVYDKLGKRELIDWDGNSWVDVGVRGYRLVVYSNKK